MADIKKNKNPDNHNFTAKFRKFYRWLTSPHVMLALIMLAIMIYLIIIPLFRMISTTLTIQDKDLITQPDAVLGQFTLYHWSRMLFSKISKIMLYAPLRHSLFIADGCNINCWCYWCMMAWFVVRTDMRGRKIINVLAIIPYMMPSWTISMAWLVMFKNRTIGGAPGIIEFLIGSKPSGLVSLWPISNHDQQRITLLSLLFPICFDSININ